MGGPLLAGQPSTDAAVRTGSLERDSLGRAYCSITAAVRPASKPDLFSRAAARTATIFEVSVMLMFVSILSFDCNPAFRLADLADDGDVWRIDSMSDSPQKKK